MDGFKNTTKMKYMGGGMVDGYSMGGYAKGGNAKPMMKGGDAKPMMAKGGNAKVGAKISKVMGEFKKGDLHSGSKDGPKVKSPKQAMAIALSEAGKGKGKMPMKKNEGGKIGKMPPLGESVKSGNRMSKMTAAEMREMEARFGNKRRPSPADSVRSANRIAKEEADEARHFGVFKKGGKVRKYAEGGPVKPSFDASYHYQNLGANLKDMIDRGQLTIEQANALKAPAFEATRLRDVGQQQQAMQAALDAVYGKQPGVDNAPLVYGPNKPFDASASYQKFGADLKGMIDSGQLTMEQANALRAPAFEATRLRDPAQQESAMYAALAAARMPSGVGSAPGVGVRAEPKRPEPPTYPTYYDRIQPQVMPPPGMQPMVEPLPPLPPPVTRTYDKFRPQVMPPLMMEQPTPPLQNLGQVLQRIQQKQPPVDRGFIDRMPRMNVPEGPPPAGMAPVNPNQAMMMKHGGRAAMSKGKR